VRILFSLQIANENDVNSLKQNNQRQEMSLGKAKINSHQENNLQNQETTKTVTRVEQKLGRNDLIKITNGEETKELKYKKAQPLIETGEWKII
jgi:preprotein translocase subunit SecA